MYVIILYITYILHITEKEKIKKYLKAFNYIEIYYNQRL